MNENITISLIIPNYEWSKTITVYTSSKGYVMDEVVHDATMKGIKFQNKMQPPSLKLKINVDGQKIYFYSPVWIMNCTGNMLSYRSGSAKDHVTNLKRKIEISKTSFKYYQHHSSNNKTTSNNDTHKQTQQEEQVEEKKEEGKNQKAKESVHRVYGKHCSWHFYFSSLPQTSFIVIVTFFSILKHPNKSFLTQ